MLLQIIQPRLIIQNSSKKDSKQDSLKRALDIRKKMYFKSKILLEKIEINNDLNIDNKYNVYKYLEFQKKYIKIDKKIEQLYKDINSKKNI